MDGNDSGKWLGISDARVAVGNDGRLLGFITAAPGTWNIQRQPSLARSLGDVHYVDRIAIAEAARGAAESARRSIAADLTLYAEDVMAYAAKLNLAPPIPVSLAVSMIGLGFRNRPHAALCGRYQGSRLFCAPVAWTQACDSKHACDMKKFTVIIVFRCPFEGTRPARYENSGGAGMDVRAAVPDRRCPSSYGRVRGVVRGLSVAYSEGYADPGCAAIGLAPAGLTCLNTRARSQRLSRRSRLSDHLGEAPFTMRAATDCPAGAGAGHATRLEAGRRLDERPGGWPFRIDRQYRPCNERFSAHIFDIDNALDGATWILFRWS